MATETRINKFKQCLHEIHKKLEERDLKSLKFFAYDKLPASDVESSSTAFLLFDRLNGAEVISEDQLGWLRVVFRELDLKPVLELLNEYEMKQNVGPYKVMLHRVAMNIGEKDLEVMKIFSEINKSVVDDINTSLDLITELEKHGKINRDNVNFLEQVLRQLEDKKLGKIIVTSQEKNFPNSLQLCKDFEKNLIQNVKSDPKLFWRYCSSKLKNKHRIDDIQANDSPKTQRDLVTAAILNTYFATVFICENVEDMPSLETN
ncbi:hypothetical protein LSH36_677g04030 [Paralvinella palmiformis]|uniref:DED domain-containing protein n=1 Tax=Paralvinella palmiformis TaxID=53620 RepID=A0AAD9J386_9ANNE|nr:hypothetical protein LSH36_677g04030 [Paralvinella palmiformis]